MPCAIAVLSVVVYHLNAAWLPGGFAGVDIFFVISGFIVSASVGSLDRVGLLKFVPYFYARRLQRIGPALLVCLLATTAASTILIPTAWLSDGIQRTGLFAFFGLSNFILAQTNNDYFSPVAEFNPFTHTWSLGVEEQFYFIFPLLFVAWSFRGKWRTMAVALFAVAFGASIVHSAWLGQVNKTAAFYMITSRFWQLAAGVLLYQFMTLAGKRFDIAEQPSPRWFMAGAVASLVLIAYGFATASPATFPFPGSFPAVIGTLGLLGFLHGKGSNNPIMRILGSAPVLFVGKISYSLYLWHWPVFVLFRWTVGLESPGYRALGLALAFALAVASYYFVETPFRRLPAARRAPRMVIVGVGLACVGASAWLATQITAAQPVLSASTVTRHAAEWYPYGSGTDAAHPDCRLEITNTPLSTGAYLTYKRIGCDTPASGPRLYVIGDSHSVAYEAMYKRYVLQTGGQVVLYGNAGCPFMSLQPWREQNEPCLSGAKAAVEDMLAKLQPGDIVFLASLRLPRFADQWARFPDDKAWNEMFGQRAVQGRQQAVAGAKSMLAQFHAKGAKVIVDAPKPIFRAPPFRCAEGYNQSNPVCEGGSLMDRAELEAMRKPVVDALNELARAVPGMRIWDPFPILCPAGAECSAYRQGHPLFFDADHLSGYGNELLAPYFIDFVRQQG